MPYPFRILAPALLCMGLSVSSEAAIDYSVPFNLASILDQASNDGGGQNAGSGNPSLSPAVVNVDVSSSSNLPGRIVGMARADFGTMKASLQISGSITDHTANARSNEWYTVTDPNVANGSPGVLHLSYTLSGEATVHDVNGNGVPGDWVFASLSVFKDQTGSDLGDLISQVSVALTNGGAVQPPLAHSRLVADIDFLYGVPFNITTIFGVSAVSDVTFIFQSPGATLVRTGGVVDFVEANFANSADLVRVFIPEGSTLVAASPFDYSSLIRFGAPVPLPAAFYFLISALVVGLKFRQRCR